MVSVRRVAPVLLLVMATAFVAASASAQKQSSQPPRDLHRVGDHWTAYNPPDPATYPAGAQTHTIKSRRHALGSRAAVLQQPLPLAAAVGVEHLDHRRALDLSGRRAPGRGEGRRGSDRDGADAGAHDHGHAATRHHGRERQRLHAPRRPTTASPWRASPCRTTPSRWAPRPTSICYGYIGDPNEPMPNYVAVARRRRRQVRSRAPMPDMSAIGRAGRSRLHRRRRRPPASWPARRTSPSSRTNWSTIPPPARSSAASTTTSARSASSAPNEPGRSRAIVTQACREIHIGARLKPMPAAADPARAHAGAAGVVRSAERHAPAATSSTRRELGPRSGRGHARADQPRPRRPDRAGRLPHRLPRQPAHGPAAQVLGELGILTTEARTATASIVGARRECCRRSGRSCESKARQRRDRRSARIARPGP